jgi:hypothetical protein
LQDAKSTAAELDESDLSALQPAALAGMLDWLAAVVHFLTAQLPQACKVRFKSCHLCYFLFDLLACVALFLMTQLPPKLQGEVQLLVVFIILYNLLEE